MKPPVAIFFFNRPDIIGKTIGALAQSAPRRVYLIADGPRHAAEAEKCAEVRTAAENAVRWKCEIITHYSSMNLGCRKRFISGLDYLFSNETQAVILEDDTLCAPTFYEYCTDMLDRYEECKRVFSITGTNILPISSIINKSEFLSNYTHIWGWATWSRAWSLYDRQLTCLDDTEFAHEIRRVAGSNRHTEFWIRLLNDVRNGKIDTWDYQLQASAWRVGAGCITPRTNLITNVGFRSDATHTVKPSIFSNLKIPAPYIRSQAPASLSTCRVYDWWFQNVFHNANTTVGRARSFALRLRDLRR